jgi:DNA mismatch repair protein MutL
MLKCALDEANPPRDVALAQRNHSTFADRIRNGPPNRLRRPAPQYWPQSAFRNDLETQRLLMPLILQLTPGQQIEYARIADELTALGFESEPFGNRTIAVTAAPAAVGAADLETILGEILETAEAEFRGLSLEDVRRSIAASIACHAAIKINTRLDHTKMEWLLRAVAATDCPMSCPHGRPIALQYSMREILKAFHRI